MTTNIPIVSNLDAAISTLHTYGYMLNSTTTEINPQDLIDLAKALDIIENHWCIHNPNTTPAHLQNLRSNHHAPKQ